MDAIKTVKLPPLLYRKGVLKLLVVALLAEVGYAVLNISTMPVYLREDRNFGEGVIALVVTAFLLSEAVLKGTMGHLADRYGRRRMMVLGPACTILTPILTLAVPHGAGYTETFALIGLRIMDGVGAAMLWPAAFALMNDTVGDDERQEAMSLLNMCYLVGIAIALPIGGAINDLFGAYLVDLGGQRTPSLWLASILFTSVTLIAYRTIPSGKEHREARRTEVEAAGGSEEFRQFLASAKRIPRFLVLGFVTFMGIGFPMVPIKLFAFDQFQMSETRFGMVALPAAILMAALSVPMSKLGERIGRIRAVHLGMMLCVIGLGVICTGAFFTFFRTAWMLAAGGIPIGVGFLLTIPAWYASVSEIDPKRRAANIGAVMTAQGLGAIVGAPLGGAIYQHWEWFGNLYAKALAGSHLDEWMSQPAFQALTDGFGRYMVFIGCFVCILAAWLLGLRILKHPSPASESH